MGTLLGIGSFFGCRCASRVQVAVAADPQMDDTALLTFQAFKAVWDWIVLLLVIYTAIFTPYVAAFLLNEYDFSSKKSKGYGDDPIVIIDLLGRISLSHNL